MTRILLTKDVSGKNDTLAAGQSQNTCRWQSGPKSTQSQAREAVPWLPLAHFRQSTIDRA